MTFQKCGCCYFWASWSADHVRTTWEEGGGGGGEPTTRRRRWWNKGVKALMKVREWSEILAGPRWKTFIRRLRRNNKGGGGRFGYDPLSYALNFDDGNGSDNSDEDNARRSFSVRYAAPPVLGGWDPPPARAETDVGE